MNHRGTEITELGAVTRAMRAPDSLRGLCVSVVDFMVQR
jgi:hypothetical protein